MNKYEKYVRGSIFLEEKTINQDCVNKFWVLVNEAASKKNPPFSQKLIDEAKKKCQNMLNPNVPEFLPRNPEVLREISTQAKFDKLYQRLVEGIRQQKVLKDLLIANNIESQNFQETENVYQMCLICYTNHFKNYNCQTDLQNGFSSSDEENLTPTDSTHWLEGQEVTHFPYNHFKNYNCQTDLQNGFSSSDEENLTPTDSTQLLEGQEVTHFPNNQPFFQGYNYPTDMDTGFSSSGDENLIPTESVQWFEHQEVIQMDHQVTEGCYNPYYQNQVDNV